MCNEKDYLTFSSNGDNTYEQSKVVLSILRKYKKDFLKIKSEIPFSNKESVFPSLITVVIRLMDVFLEEDKKMENMSKIFQIRRFNHHSYFKNNRNKINNPFLIFNRG